MRTALSIFAGNRPFSAVLFGRASASDDDRINSRLDSLHKALSGTGPKARFFRH